MFTWVTDIRNETTSMGRIGLGLFIWRCSQGSTGFEPVGARRISGQYREKTDDAT